jgi:hypothetical protein
MLNWTKWFKTAAFMKPAGVKKPTGERLLPSRGCGTYEPLHKYLNDRYATIVVLTLSEIEDILGFALPARARTDSAWWTTGDPDTRAGRYTDAWKLASRTAVPNLVARAVVFERLGSY